MGSGVMETAVLSTFEDKLTSLGSPPIARATSGDERYDYVVRIAEALVVIRSTLAPCPNDYFELSTMLDSGDFSRAILVCPAPIRCGVGRGVETCTTDELADALALSPPKLSCT